MSDLHEWLAAARLGAYESLVREYAGDLDDIAELTPERRRRDHRPDQGEGEEAQVRRGVRARRRALAARSADVRAPAQGILPCLSGFVISSAIVLRSSYKCLHFSAPLCSQGRAEGGGAASASSAASASTTAASDVLGGQSSGNPPPTRAAALARSRVRDRDRDRDRDATSAPLACVRARERARARRSVIPPRALNALPPRARRRPFRSRAPTTVPIARADAVPTPVPTPARWRLRRPPCRPPCQRPPMPTPPYAGVPSSSPRGELGVSVGGLVVSGMTQGCVIHA